MGRIMNFLWTKKNGKMINVKDMKDDHLLNTVIMLKRSIKARSRILFIMRKERFCRFIKLIFKKKSK